MLLSYRCWTLILTLYNNEIVTGYMQCESLNRIVQTIVINYQCFHFSHFYVMSNCISTQKIVIMNNVSIMQSWRNKLLKFEWFLYSPQASSCYCMTICFLWECAFSSECALDLELFTEHDISHISLDAFRWVDFLQF